MRLLFVFVFGEVFVDEFERLEEYKPEQEQVGYCAGHARYCFD
jgi:hypothetical protein